MTSKEKPPEMDAGGLLMAWMKLLSIDYADFTDFWRSKFLATSLMSILRVRVFCLVFSTSQSA